jgi:hypothetical protein
MVCVLTIGVYFKIVLGIILAIILVAFLALCLRTFRSKHKDPKYIPTPLLRRLWKDWRVPAHPSRYQQASADDSADVASSHQSSRLRAGSATFENTLTQSQSNTQTAGGVDRNTSIRSILTLPAYRRDASNTEQVIGREGDRDGVDVVVELPTAEEMEAMREDEMEALYNIRLARRQQIEDREERRRLRREARDRNDVVALERLRDRTRDANSNTVVDELRSEHQRLKEQRQRAVSSVSYADLGVARLDGTRLRANSTESERVGLLSDAASFAASSTRSGARSSLQSIPNTHRRERSAGSVVSIDSDFPSPALTRSRAGSRPDTPRLSTGGTRAGSSPEIIEADVGESDMPPHSPPGYDDVSLDDARSGTATPLREPPPDYPGPSQIPAERLASHTAHLAVDEEGAEESRGRMGNDARRASRGVGGIPQLPSLRLNRLPQIVIEPSSARPRDHDR